MKYKQLNNEQRFVLSLAQTMFPKGSWCGISEVNEWVEKSKPNPFFSMINFCSIIAYLEEKANFHYNQWQSDFKPDKGLCPDNKTLEAMRAEQLLSLQSLKTAMYGN